MAVSERLLLYRIRRFIPRKASVIAVEVAPCNPLGGSPVKNPIVLTDKALLFVSSKGARAIVTRVPFDQVAGTRGDHGFMLIVWWDEVRRENRTVTLDFTRGHRDPDAFLGQVVKAMRPWLKPHKATVEGPEHS